MVIVPGDRALESGLKLRGFREAKGSDFSGKEAKTPTLPKARRVGHPKNLKQKLSVDASQRHYPAARFHQLKAPERIGHPSFNDLSTEFGHPILKKIEGN
jgi:hypothetical protein